MVLCLCTESRMHFIWIFGNVASKVCLCNLKKIEIKCVKAPSNVKYVQLLDALKEHLQVCNIESFE
jgi:hypothetical protein